MYLVDGTGATVAACEYDPYGNILSATGPMAEINPLRYRGYYYDAELEMYYLQSRYYDPMMGRFINADESVCLGVRGTVLGYNSFSYYEKQKNWGDFCVWGPMLIYWQRFLPVLLKLVGKIVAIAEELHIYRCQKSLEVLCQNYLQ